MEKSDTKLSDAKSNPADANLGGVKLPKVKLKGEKGQYGETLRPSEREDTYVPTEEKAEGLRSQTSDAPHA